MFCGFTALSLLPIADATAIGYAAPLMTVVLAVIFLGEKVRIYRWSAVAVGFLGVLVILSDYVGPEAAGAKQASTLGAIIAVVGAFLGAAASTQVRAMVRTEAAVDHRRLFLAVHARSWGWAAPVHAVVDARGRSMPPCWSVPASSAVSAR